jgi:hypothetical protein
VKRAIPPQKNVLATPKYLKVDEDEKGRMRALIFFTLDEGPAAGEDIGRSFWLHTEAVAPYTVETMRTCGCTFPGNDITAQDGFGETQVRLTIVEEEGQDGVFRPEIKWVNPKTKANDMPAGKRAAFKDKFASLIAKSAPKGEAAPTEGGGGGFDSSDVPF